jgi:Cu/Ag efflux pump CusA
MEGGSGISGVIATIGGFLPLIIAGGTFWPPLATAIAGGVAGSAIIALYTVPTLYLMIVRSSNKKVQVQPLVAVPFEPPLARLAS